MKIESLTLTNISKFDKVTVNFDESVTYLIGKNGAGKSTVGITGIWFVMQGIAEKASGGNTPLIGERFRFIGPKAATGKGELVFVDEKKGNARIVVTRKLTKTGTELSFTAQEDYGQLDQAWLNNLFNVFLIAPKMFCELSPKDQAKALGINADSFDKEIAALKLEHTGISRDIKAFGTLEPVEETKEVDLIKLQADKERIRAELNKSFLENKAINKATRDAWEAGKKEVDKSVSEFNKEQEAFKKKRERALAVWQLLTEEGYDDQKYGSSVDTWYSSLTVEQPGKIASELYKPEPINLAEMAEDYQPAAGEAVYIKEMPDDSVLQEIDKQIFEAGEINKKALLYAQYLEKKKAKEAKEKEFADNKTKQKVKEDERIEYIKKFKFPFSNLTVSEDGELLLAGKPIKEPYFSTGEILKAVPILLSTANPDLKYVFLQDFNLMDEDKQAEVSDYLTEKGFQLVVELVGKSKVTDKNCILLKDSVIVESYEEVKEPELV